MLYEDARKLLGKTIRAGRLSHAFLVTGDPRGAARDFSEWIAAALLCQNANPEPCGECADCDKINKHTLPDMLWIEPERKSRIIPVDLVRKNIIPWVNSTSFAGGWKILVVSFADRFNDESGNAFLKSLEEPPDKTLILLLTTSPDLVLTTIRSRCQRIDLSQGREPPAEPWRGKVGEIMANHSRVTELGSFATASRLDAVFQEIATEAKAAIKAEREREREDESAPDEDPEVYEARENAKFRELRMAAFEALQDWHRDLLVICSGGGDRTLFFEEHRDALEHRARGMSARQAVNALEGVETMARQIDERHMPIANVLSYWMGRLG